ncbi:MAG: UPF0182 family protein, partial [Chloroflexi bacterium]|nr:UPF0182 family protein [Chloroflexota bacterium]
MRWLLAVVLAALLLIFLSTDAHLYVDFLWFQSEQVAFVFTTTLRYEAFSFAIAGVVAFVFLFGNWLVARRVARGRGSPLRTIVVDNERHLPLVSAGSLVAALVLALFFASSASSHWRLFALAFHQQPITTMDPILHRSVSWYLFLYPLLQYLYGWVVSLLVVTALGVGVIFTLMSPQFIQMEPIQPGMGQVRVSFSPPRSLFIHAAVIGSAFFIVQGAAYHWLSTAGLLLTGNKTAFGVDFVDAHIRLPAFDILAAVMVVAAGFCIVAAVRESLGWFLAAPVLWISVALLGLGILPGIVQAVYVAPSELRREEPFIADNIAATRSAFALDSINVSSPKLSPLTEQDVKNNQTTVNNIRLWDWRPLLETFQQLQGLRPYYVFNDVDIDRYAGQQEMLSARQLDVSRLPQAAQNWQNQHLVYTHGFGVVGTPAQGVTAQGTPDFNLRDIPPVTTNPLLTITQPRIYFTSGGTP